MISNISDYIFTCLQKEVDVIIFYPLKYDFLEKRIRLMQLTKGDF